jgi:hypothetical protein
MQFEEFLFLCGLCICYGLCITFGGLLGIGIFAVIREAFKRS